MHPFDHPEAPRAQRAIAAPIEAVYGALDDVESWPKWLDDLEGPATTPGGGHYELTERRGDERVPHRLRVTTRGPVHTLFFEVDDGRSELYFRTRPQSGATLAEAVLVLPEPSGLRQRLEHRRVMRECRERLSQMLDALARHVEQGSSA